MHTFAGTAEPPFEELVGDEEKCTLNKSALLKLKTIVFLILKQSTTGHGIDS